MNLKSVDIEGFSHFESLKDFDYHIDMWLFQHKRDFSKCQLVGLKWLVQFSKQTPGVCNSPIGTLLNAIYEEPFEHGISRTTFKRMIIKAKKLGMITVYETERENGSQSSNLYVFKRFPTEQKTNNP